ncbi:sarcosine oxidase subunit delta [Rubellimicrobium sp. CFH 75288]|uniref:sarcosine oxidase subunit delta n=1 Tax=Rubellimicrobium sp. CFH 75288 TaxID=2697034 RepID=UPI0014132A28|nr:sarcosine oxidase subunit delta [Rubellimicrobium sp. CFH 75288]NAZ36190.1 sarcosine oxidase subunit delta [Rubellimicrobium sp. CFH 75288]
MRVTCPFCGERDRREFTVQGDATALARPDRDAGAEAWDAFLHLRDNPAGRLREMWYHDPCGAWLVVDRDTVTHAVHGAIPAREAAR